MRKFIAFGVGLLGVSAMAHALPDDPIIVQNAPATPTMQGQFPVQPATFSDGLSSGGNYFYSQSLAQQFVIGQGSTAAITGINFWGCSEYLGVNEPWTQQALSANITGFDISVLRVTENGAFPVVRSWSLSREQVLSTAYGTYKSGGLSPVFELQAALDGNLSLNSGVYAISIGARLANPDGDAFAWVAGQWTGSDPSTRLYATIGDVPSEWGIFTAVQTDTSGSFRLTGTVVPGPGALALAGLAGLMGGRRRRA